VSSRESPTHGWGHPAVSRVRRRPCWLLAALLAAGCSVSDPTPEAGVELTSARWRLDWDGAGVQPTSTGGSTTTDQGFDVEVDAGWMVDHTITLAPCANVTARGVPFVGVAHAHHLEFSDSSEILLSRVTDLTSPQPLGITGGSFGAATCCGFHWLVARLSLSLSGRWSRGGASGSIAVETSLPNAREYDFPADLAPADGSVSLVITRRLAGLLDGLDFEADNDNAIAWTVLANLVAQAETSAR
jgi:hypothetical protein